MITNPRAPHTWADALQNNCFASLKRAKEERSPVSGGNGSSFGGSRAAGRQNSWAHWQRGHLVFGSNRLCIPAGA